MVIAAHAPCLLCTADHMQEHHTLDPPAENAEQPGEILLVAMLAQLLVSLEIWDCLREFHPRVKFTQSFWI
jgi:hypothetical protein